MLKQARAFGVGLVLATQNPVDVDYKGLSNAGTWFIGKLATDQDKARLIDGLSSADGSVDVKEYNRLISGIGKRVFLLRNVHAKRPLLFQTRWAMNYLAGPLTRAQIPALNALKGAGPAAARPAGAAAAARAESSPPPAPAEPPSRPATPGTAAAEGTVTRPPIPSGMGEYFLPASLRVAEAAERQRVTLPTGAVESGVLYRPVLLAQADARLTNAKYNLNTTTSWAALATDPAAGVRWDEVTVTPLDDRALDRAPLRDARFASLAAPLSDAKAMRALETDFVDWIVRNGAVAIRANEALKVYAGPGTDDAAWEALCRDAADDRMQADLDKVKARFETKLRSAEDKLRKEERELAEDKAEYEGRKREEYAKHAETLLGFLGGRRKSLSGSLSKRRMAENARADIEESEQTILTLQEQVGDLKEEMEAALDEIEARWEGLVADTREVPVAPRKTDVRVTLFGVAWQPHYLVTDVSGRAVELMAYGE